MHYNNCKTIMIIMSFEYVWYSLYKNELKNININTEKSFIDIIMLVLRPKSNLSKITLNMLGKRVEIPITYPIPNRT